ncbi:MAG: N-acetylmuramoyl-L-alanine amidase [Candidatus Firestonebacteria bacterium]
MGKIKSLSLLIVVAGLIAQGAAQDILKPDAAQTEVVPERIIKVVIDPGHGGKDGGAVGNKGTREKDIVLDISNLLAKALVDAPERRFKAILTRAEDKFVTLEDRISFANQYEGDLFISIHANSSESKRDNGFEVYYNSLATDDSAVDIVKRENAGASEKKEPQSADSMFVLWELAQNEFQKESMDFADKIQAGVKSSFSKPLSSGKMQTIRNRGVKQAAFAVLRGVRMPAVLVESAYLSNENDENNLRSAEFKEKMVLGLYEAINNMAKKLDKQQEGVK